MNFKDAVETLLKLILGIAGACYVIGFIVVNAYLNRFGYFSVSLLQAQYVIAGFWALLPVLLGWFVFFFALSEEQRQLPTLGITLLIAFLGCAVSVVLLNFFTGWLVTLEWFDRMGIFAGIGFFFSLGAVAIAWLALELYRLGQMNQPRVISTMVVLPLIACVLIFFYFVSFGRYFYDVIPARLGGGQPMLVRFVVKREALAGLKATGVPYTGELPLRWALDLTQTRLMSDPVCLIAATDKEYIVRTANLTVSISSESVQTVRYEVNSSPSEIAKFCTMTPQERQQ